MCSRFGKCPHCGNKMQIGDELPEERICGKCAAAELRDWHKNADRVDGYDRDDLGESSDF
jgi:endogenous inhibitor of DNA gyrase (YacG/DUF329 family)